MKTRIAIILLSTSLYAQNALWIDLSGPWLSHAGEDSPAYADPAFDDRHWTRLRASRLPLASQDR